MTDRSIDATRRRDQDLTCSTQPPPGNDAPTARGGEAKHVDKEPTYPEAPIATAVPPSPERVCRGVPDYSAWPTDLVEREVNQLRRQLGHQASAGRSSPLQEQLTVAEGELAKRVAAERKPQEQQKIAAGVAQRSHGAGVYVGVGGGAGAGPAVQVGAGVMVGAQGPQGYASAGAGVALGVGIGAGVEAGYVRDRAAFAGKGASTTLSMGPVSVSVGETDDGKVNSAGIGLGVSRGTAFGLTHTTTVTATTSSISETGEP